MHKVIEVSKDFKQFRLVSMFGDETTGVWKKQRKTKFRK